MKKIHPHPSNRNSNKFKNYYPTNILQYSLYTWRTTTLPPTDRQASIASLSLCLAAAAPTNQSEGSLGTGRTPSEGS